MEDLNMSPADRLASEVELLEAMFPDQIKWDATKSRELRFVHTNGGDLVLRLPDTYPESGLPTLVGATTIRKEDIRHEMKTTIAKLDLHEGEEVLDTIIQCYQDVVAKSQERTKVPVHSETTGNLDHTEDGSFKVVIIWLHHLLATSKRKLALDPTLNSESSKPKLSGVTKPGYPGVMLFSGPSSLVDPHVAELKNQRWQAFQVRFEETCDNEQAWRFVHGDGIKELESMSDIVQDIVGNDKQEAFLKAIGVK